MELIKKDLTMTSRDLASISGRRHADVMKEIRKEIDDLGYLAEGIFSLSEYTDGSGKANPMYVFGKDGAMQMAMKYNAEIRRKVILRLEELENSLSLPKNYKEALKCLIVSIEEKEKLEIEIKENVPRVEFAKTIEGTSDKISVGDLAKLTDGKIGRNRLFKVLRDKNILMKGNVPYQSYIDRGYFEVSERVVKAVNKDIISLTTYVTGKGQVWILSKLKEWEMY